LIFFFSIPAHGHVNPTLPLVRELVSRGHAVRYYEAEAFRSAIESTGASFVPIDGFLPPAPDDLSSRAGKDFASLIEMAADTTLALDAQLARDVAAFRPACVVSDSVCLWGKLLAQKHGLPFVCSTTTLAFNAHTARRMKQRPFEALRMLLGMGRIHQKLSMLREHGFDAPDLPSLIGNDDQTRTLVYTSRLFQPEAETFRENYAFVGPLTAQRYPRVKHDTPRVYVSLGTVLNDAPRFYRACIRALAQIDCEATLSIGPCVDPASLGPLPENIRVYPRVNQMEVLASCDAFVTHCGMNSVSESLSYGVPMVLYPQHSEEEAIAGRVEELGAGLRLGRPTPENIRRAVNALLRDKRYQSAAQRIAEDFSLCGGAKEAADFVEAQIPQI